MDQNKSERCGRYGDSVKRRIRLPLLFVGMVGLVSSAGRADLVTADFETILLPIAFVGSQPGAYGSVWTSDFWVFADSDATAIFADSTGCNLFPGWPPGKPCEQTWTVPPHFQNHGDFQGGLPGDPPGLLLYLGKQSSSSTRFNLRIQDTSRQAETWGTELPVVRETEFRSDRIELLNVPLDDRFRQTLRVYDPDVHDQAVFRVTFFDMVTNVKLVETMINAQTGKTYVRGFPRVPSVAQLSNFRGSIPQLLAADVVRIEIQPVTPGIRIWAFVSVTNNSTQHVTTITPQ